METVNKTFISCLNEFTTKANEDFDTLKSKVAECAGEMYGNGTSITTPVTVDENDNEVEDVSDTGLPVDTTTPININVDSVTGPSQESNQPDVVTDKTEMSPTTIGNVSTNSTMNKQHPQNK